MTREEEVATARREIEVTLKYCTFCAKKVGLAFLGPRGGAWRRALELAWGAVSALALLQLVVGEIVRLYALLQTSATVDNFVVSLHIIGFGIISQAKMLTMYQKREAFAGLVTELADLWPVDSGDREAMDIKRSSLQTLKLFQFWYTFLTELGVNIYTLSPLAGAAWQRARGRPAAVGFVWHADYAWDKHAPGWHVFTFVFEAFAGQASVWYMLTADLLFSVMTSHISMLLRLLQLKIRRLGTSGASGASGTSGDSTGQTDADCLAEITSCVKMHQRLIKYFNDLEDTFSLVNLVNVTLSSVDICCVVFVIAVPSSSCSTHSTTGTSTRTASITEFTNSTKHVLLEPWMDMRNKFFLVSALLQTGALCWSADDISTVSVEVAYAVYESGWYGVDARCRRALLVIAQRAQKPFHFTAMKFNDITMNTYVSILTTAYSYFTLLYTMYSED